MSELLTVPATALVRLMAKGELSASELAELHLQRIAELNPALNAIVDYDAELVRAQARRLDAVAKDERGLLHGLPVTVKASISVAGHLCETGSRLNQGLRPAEDALVVRRMRDAGAVIVGTTNCPEFLMAYETKNALHGRTNNPWDLERSPGGSSGGESAAIAAGLSAGGLGSDGGGSVRTPAHFTGVCALKPTPGRVPGAGHLPACAGPFSLLGVIGPMARTMEDVELLFRAVSGASEVDPVGAPVEYRAASDEAMRRVKIGYFEDDGLAAVTPETRAAVRDAADALRREGFRVEAFRPKTLELVRRLWWTYFVRFGAMLLEPLFAGREEVMSETFRGFLGIAHREAALSGGEVLRDWAEADLMRGKLLEEMREYPVLLTPVCSVPAFRHGERVWKIGEDEVEYLDAMRFTQWFNLLGGPAAVVPVGASAERLPIGVQVAGRPYEDESVMAVAGVIDRAFGYKTPPMEWRS